MSLALVFSNKMDFKSFSKLILIKDQIESNFKVICKKLLLNDLLD
jgi:hypothetical protein